MEKRQSTFVAESVRVPDNDLLDAGEGEIEFRWPDALVGWEGLTIDLEGFCHRRMPIRSGGGPPELVELHSDHIKLRFDPALAEKLQLTEVIEIRFTLPDDDFRQLKRTFEYLRGELD